MSDSICGPSSERHQTTPLSRLDLTEEERRLVCALAHQQSGWAVVAFYTAALAPAVAFEVLGLRTGSEAAFVTGFILAVSVFIWRIWVAFFDRPKYSNLFRKIEEFSNRESAESANQSDSDSSDDVRST